MDDAWSWIDQRLPSRSSRQGQILPGPRSRQNLAQAQQHTIQPLQETAQEAARAVSPETVDNLSWQTTLAAQAEQIDQDSLLAAQLQAEELDASLMPASSSAGLAQEQPLHDSHTSVHQYDQPSQQDVSLQHSAPARHTATHLGANAQLPENLLGSDAEVYDPMDIAGLSQENIDTTSLHGRNPGTPDAAGPDQGQTPSECSVCLEKRSDTAVSCGHVCVCIDCSVRLDKCPVCRKPGVAFKQPVHVRMELRR